MIFWSLALIVTAIACAALYYAGARTRVNAPAADVDSPDTEHLRRRLREIDADAAAERLQPGEITAARAEVAREMLRLQAVPKPASAPQLPRSAVVLGVAVTAVMAVGVYAAMGRPDLPALPLAARPDQPAPEVSLEEAVARIETQLAETPEDMRGWRVIAPAYMQLGRFAEAAEALRTVIAADGVTADLETDLGEAVMMANGGTIGTESLALFESAAARDPAHIRSRYYMASAAMQSGDLEAAKAHWSELIALAKGDEPWLAGAQAGLAAANGDVGQMDDDAIKGMVESLAARLASEGGTIDEWTRLVRSRLVLGQGEEAQKAYQAARAAYPDAGERQELDVLAADNGLMVTQ
jgi:cytochrome c-type biogenesis protein CcmH